MHLTLPLGQEGLQEAKQEIWVSAGCRRVCRSWSRGWSAFCSLRRRRSKGRSVFWNLMSRCSRGKASSSRRLDAIREARNSPSRHLCDVLRQKMEALPNPPDEIKIYNQSINQSNPAAPRGCIRYLHANICIQCIVQTHLYIFNRSIIVLNY